jgi:MoxR-like ATPase
MEAVARVVAHGRAELAKAVVGQQEFVDQALLALLCGGHALIEGVPGIAKTLVVKVLARIVQVQFQRVQCTSDLMPGDILGSNVLNLSTSTFSLHRGPIFTDLLLVDEVNRMPPRTQAALLEAMEERQITIDSVRYPLTEWFTVYATQNPVEFEGTYPLPEAQLDRFLLKLKVPYPEADQETRILENHHKGFDPHNLDQLELVCIDTELLRHARSELRQVKVEPALFKYLIDVVRRTRDWPSLALGASPRAAISLLLVAKAMAAMDARDYLIPDDIKAATLPVLRHRVVLKPEAELEGLDTDRAVESVLAAVEVPK